MTDLNQIDAGIQEINRRLDRIAALMDSHQARFNQIELVLDRIEDLVTELNA